MTNFIGFIYSILILTNFHLFCKTKIRNTWKVKQKTNFKAWVCPINNYILISFPFTFILSLNPYMSHEISIPNYSYLTNTKDKHKSSPPKSWWCWWSICNWFLPSVTRTNGCCCNGILHESPCCPLTNSSCRTATVHHGIAQLILGFLFLQTWLWSPFRWQFAICFSVCSLEQARYEVVRHVINNLVGFCMSCQSFLRGLPH